MKTNSSVAVALILWFLFFASNVFAVLRSPYPSKPSQPDRIILIGEERYDSVRMARASLQRSK
jgi:hypothetical protein